MILFVRECLGSVITNDLELLLYTFKNYNDRQKKKKFHIMIIMKMDELQYIAITISLTSLIKCIIAVLGFNVCLYISMLLQIQIK